MYRDMGTRVGTRKGTRGHRDTAGTVQELAGAAPGCAVNALRTVRLALGDRLRVSAVNCRQ